MGNSKGHERQTWDLDESGWTFELQKNSSFELLKMFKYYFTILFKTVGRTKKVKSINLWLFNIKPINPIQTYPGIAESYACVL